MPDTQLRATCYIEKGGVGKTTTCAHIARALVGEHDLEVVAIDLAGQQNDLAMQFGLLEKIETTENPAPISAVFSEQWEFITQNIPDVTERMTFETDVGVDVIPSDPVLEGADNDLANFPVEERFGFLERFVDEELGVYDAVLIDLPGKESNVALNGLAAAEHVVVPVKPGAFEREQLSKLPGILDRIAADTPVDAELRYVLPNAVDERKRIHREFLEHLEETYPELVASTAVPNSADVERTPAVGATVFDMNESDLLSTGTRARDAYATAATELVEVLT
jgi:chromosome partitioning protein